MSRLRRYRDVWLWWGKGWAVQFWPGPYLSLGLHVHAGRPLLDLHLGWLIIALGPDAHITSQADRHRHSCRGFLFSDSPHL